MYLEGYLSNRRHDVFILLIAIYGALVNINGEVERNLYTTGHGSVYEEKKQIIRTSAHAATTRRY